ncbi:hypothetical protein M9H77_07175 [Catharanthus roseus]|uniref:Uncharacterized protein n=1 Tax=Catharanthus roseus TaxID=4058 RepID=A0ACC0BU76_CATRO|nr:hypothetical protein M9H77_07175 [Catharanthus roseus]
MVKNRKSFSHQKPRKRKTLKKNNPLQNFFPFDIMDSRASREEIGEVVIVLDHVAEQEDDLEEVCKSDFYVLLSKRFVDIVGMQMSF